MDELKQVSFDKIIQTRAYTIITLKTEDKKFAIYTEVSVGKTIQVHLTRKPKLRPQTHDLIHTLCKGLVVRVKHVIINDVQDNIYFARIFLEQDLYNGMHQILEIDTRPSDAITMALYNNAPVYCTNEVLQKAVPLVDD